MIHRSMLDNDLYKFTMMQAVFHQRPNVHVKYAFKCRTENIDFTDIYKQIAYDIRFMDELNLKRDELEYLRTSGIFKEDFLQFLKGYHFNNSHVNVDLSDKGELIVEVEGPWLQTILYEVPILYIVSENYAERYHPNGDDIARANLMNKLELLKDPALCNFNFLEFGTRRRRSFEWQKELLRELKGKPNFGGTSNVLFAKELDIPVKGTMAHEWIQAHQAFYHPQDSQVMALYNWNKEYRGKLGIALSDTLGLNKFLRDFTLDLAKLYDGTRQDSGDPYEYAERLIYHYEKMGIDACTKQIIFSDGLNFKKAIDLYYAFESRIKTGFAIGTDLTNDHGFSALQVVMKMIECNHRPVAKISDSPGKTMCKNEKYLEYLRSIV